MTSTVDIRREARAAGIRGDGELNLADVEHRRRQLWTVMTVVLFLVSLAAGVWAIAPDLAAKAPVSQRFVQLALPAVALLFSAYGFEKERSLRRLTEAVLDEQVTREQLSIQARQLHAALEAGNRLSACLDAGDVVDTLLVGAMDLFDATDGSVLLFERGSLNLRATAGPDLGRHRNSDAVEAVFETHLAARMSGDDANALLAPLVVDDDCLGVIVLSASGCRTYTDHDLAVLGMFANYAAQAIANARRFEDERAEADRLRAAEAARTEFSRLQRHAV